MRVSVPLLTMAVCFSAASLAAPASCIAADSDVSYSPTLDTPLQRFTAPEDSARTGESFFNKVVTALSKEQYGLAINMHRISASWAFERRNTVSA